MSMGTIIVVMGAVLILIVIGLLFLIPTTESSKGKKKKKRELEVKVEMPLEYKQIIDKLEHQIQGFKGKLGDVERINGEIDKQLLVEKTKNKKLQEKLVQERGWLEKEEGTIEKRAKEFKSLQEELVTSQDHFVKEHSLLLKLQNEFAQLKKDLDESKEQRRTAESNESQTKALLEGYRQETAQLKAEIIELKKKKEDTVWVAKSDFEALEKKFKEREKELERIKGDVK